MKNSTTIDIHKEVEQIKALTERILRFPPISLVSDKQLTLEQEDFWEQEKRRWKIIGARIDYLQMEALGFILPDPLDGIDESVFKIYFDLATRMQYQELQLMIAGWELIKDKAIAEGRDFPFRNPRELFAESCRQIAAYTVEPALSRGINQGDSAENIRKIYRDTNSFYRDSDRLDKKRQAQMMEEHKNSPYWREFLIYAIWEKKLDKKFNRGKLSLAWRNFLNACKAESAMVCTKNYFSQHKCRLVTCKWNQGKPMLSQKSQAFSYS